MNDSKSDTTRKPEIAEWLAAYAKWFPDALMNGETQVNDAFRVGYLAVVRDMKDVQHAD